jgi:ABC-type polysaccharide/polyol phosphate transport system ATPase subunit
LTPAIRLEAVSKRFRVPLDRSTTLKYKLVHPRSTSRYRDLYALRDIDLEIPFGTFVGVIGPNGCGKSTLLKLLAGIYRPTSGRLEIEGHVSPFLELGVGFNPELTARENVYLNGAVLGLTRRELARSIDDIIGFAELEDFADQKLKSFSSGMQVRLAFSVAIQANAGILLMDEVLAVGDARFQTRCFDVFNRYRREGRTVVLVTHDIGAVDLYCDTAYLLDHGRIIAHGRAGEVTSAYRRLVGEQSDADAPEGVIPAPDVAEMGRKARWGTGEVRIATVQFLDRNGVQHQSFDSGEQMEVRLDCVVQRQVGDLICALVFHRDDGFVLGHANTFYSGNELRCPPAGEHFTVRCIIDDLRLLGGHYRVTAALAAHPHSRHIDCLEQAFEFRVSSPPPQVGILDLAPRWEADQQLLRPLSAAVARRYGLELATAEAAEAGGGAAG